MTAARVGIGAGSGKSSAVVLACVTAFALAGCGERNTYVAPPPPKVTVAPPAQRPVTYYLEATGNSAAVNTTNLVARVAGFVESIDYQDGDLVKKGKVLFTIEPQTYELKLKQSQAAEASSRATLKQAQTDFERQAELAKTGSGTRVSLDNATTTRENSQANLQQAEINTKLAALNVDYAHVTAPFDGIVTARKISIGEYVGANSSPTVLATIVQSDPIYVNFNISEQDVLKIREEIRRRGMTQADLKKVPVEIGLQNEDGYPHHGTLNYASPTVDSTTGTLTARAILDNPNRVILPGMFARVRIPLGTRNDALLVPDTALGTDQRGRYVFVVGKDNTVEQREVETGPLEGNLRVIEKGLKPDDRVVVGGILRAIPGQKVDPQSAS
ncbi:MAG TPA: efflux RND transporter periplasmic adaptor subunit [Pseudolabrys sp.]|jgi:RND family efflux transporter MFP subunit|nr:efflux RND transporter periplasmic adaptor subunit [Pseudolabrys sp.]